VLDSVIARLYEPLLGRLVGGLRRAGLDLLPPRVGMHVLDVGCGTGAHLALYAAAGCRVFGVDISEAMLCEARRRLGGGALLVGAEATRLPFDRDSFDLVVAATLLHGLPPGERVAALREMARVAGGRGAVLVIDYAPGPVQGLVAHLARALGSAVEALGGHWAGYRSFRAAGGVPGLVDEAPLAVERYAPAAFSTFGVYLLRPEPM
jgi:ubiquinone/menaquinone biosynthesis C-methylase UbiE